MGESRASEELERFLNDKQQRVLAFQGPWGIGKTYFWRQFVADRLDAIHEPVYSYASLFGVRNIDQLKDRIIANSNAKKRDLRLTGTRLLKKLDQWTEGVEIPGIGGRKAVSNLIGNVQEMLMQNWLICFDDLERKLPSMDIAEFLGLVSMLRDERGCRIVLILNNEALQGEDKTQFQKYREKVIDAVFTYQPLLRSNLRLVFPKADIAMAEQIFAGARLNNIRVMQQCVWALEYFDTRMNLGAFHGRLKDEFRQQVVKIALVHHAFSDQISIDELGSKSWMLRSIEEKKDQPKGTELLQDIEFSGQEYDRYIADSLKNGHCDLEALRDVLSRLNPNASARDVLLDLYAFYGLLNDNFQASPKEISMRALEIFDKHGPEIGWRELTQITEFLPKIAPGTDWESYAKKLLIEAAPNANERALTRLKQYSKWPEMNDAISRREGELASKLDIDALIFQLAGSDSWAPTNYAKLDQFTVQEFVDYILKSKRDDLLNLLKELLRRATGSQGEPAAPKVLDKVKAALLQIRNNGSELDKWRVDLVLKVLEK